MCTVVLNGFQDDRPLSRQNLSASLQDSSGDTTRDAVGKLVHDFGDRIARQRGPEASLLHNPLASQEAVPLLQLPRPLFLSTLIPTTMQDKLTGQAPPYSPLYSLEGFLCWR